LIRVVFDGLLTYINSNEVKKTRPAWDGPYKIQYPCTGHSDTHLKSQLFRKQR
jgi:hypothetical protein